MIPTFQYAHPFTLPNVSSSSFILHNIWNLLDALNRTGSFAILSPVFRLCQLEVFHMNAENALSISNTTKMTNLEKVF